jgi:hypothetical protein
MPSDWIEERLEIEIGPGPPLVWRIFFREVPGGYQVVVREPEADPPEPDQGIREGGWW